MSDAVPGPMSDGTMSDATNAFQAAMDAETPSRTRAQPERRTEKDPDDDPRMGLDDLFPQRTMNRDEEEGGENEPGPQVQEEDEPEDEDQGPRDEPDDEDDEEEGDEPDDDGAEDAQAAAGPIDLNQVIQTTIDGEVVELPLGEAIRSGMRERTFHKYLSQLDLAVRETNQQRQNLSEHYNKHLEAVREFEAWITELLPEPDWPELFRKDVQAATLARVEWDAIMQKRAAVRQHFVNIQAQERAESNRQLHNFASANRAQMMAAHKEWSNDKVYRRDHDSMRRTAKSVGYTDQEVDALYDARAIEVLLKASKYDRLMAAKPKPVKQGFTPGKRNGATPSRNVSRAFDRAERRVSRGAAKDSLTATFERMLNSEG